MINGNIIQPTGTLPRNFFQSRIQPNPISNQRVPSNLVDTEQPDCVDSHYLNKLGSNIVFVANADRISNFSCAELGSPMRSASDLYQALSIVQTRYADTTPVTISFSPGNYANTITRTLILPENVVGLVCTQGSAKIRCNLVSKNLKKLDIQNMELLGNLDIIADGNHKGKVSWKNGNLYGTYKYTVKDSAVQSFTMEKVDQLVRDDFDGPYDNIVAVTGNGIGRILLNQYTLHSPFKGKIDVLDSGKLTRKTENCFITYGGEDIQIKENAIIDYTEKDNEIKKHVDSIGEYLKINVMNSGRINMRRFRNLTEGTLQDGFFWFDRSAQDNGVVDIYCESNRWNLSGLGGFLKFVGSDKSRYIVNIFQDSIHMSRNDELRPIFKRILNDSCTFEYNSITNYSVYAPSHYYENIHNDNSQFKARLNTVKYTLGGCHRTCIHDSIIELDYNNYSIFCDEEIGYHQKKILNHNSVVSEKLANTIEKLCNDGIHSIYDLQQNGNSEFKWSDFNTSSEYKLENRSVHFDENNNKPCVYDEQLRESSKLYVSRKQTQDKVISGKNCDGIWNANFKNNSKCYESCINKNVEMILEDENAIGLTIELSDNALDDFIEDSSVMNQTGGKIMYRVQQNNDSKFEFNSHKQILKHKSSKNGKTIDVVLNQNAELSVVKSLPNMESDGTIWDMVTNDNSKISRNIRGGKASSNGKLAKLQSNHNSVQNIKLFETDLSTVNDDLLEIDGNEKDDISFNNCQVSGNFLAKKVSNLDMQNSSMHGVLHAVQCGKIESNNSSHVGLNSQSPIVLENTSTCNIQSCKMETTSSTPHLQTKTDGKCRVNLKGVIFADAEENSSLACIETDGKGETVCEVGTCSSKRSKFLSAKSEQDGRSTTTFSRNNEFGSDGLDPTVDGQVTEASTSLVIQNGSLVSTPEDDCGPNEDEIQIIPRNVSDVPYFTMYYCLALPQYDYFVSSSISFKDIIDSYQSKDAKSGCFTATSVRSMTDENGDPMDGMYIMIDGVRTPNDKNALQTDKDGKIIDRNLKDSLYMEKYHITKIDPSTKRSVAQLGGNLQYTDGSGTGATTCIPRLIFPIHYASGEWAPLENGYIEWNYDNKKETDYKRELRFFSR